MGTTPHCVDGDLDDNANIWCIDGSGNIWYGARGDDLTEYISGANAANIVTDHSGSGRAAFISTSGVIGQYSADIGSFQTWSVCGLTARAAKGSIGIGSDGSVVVMGTAGNLWVSHDWGNSCSEPDMNGLSSSATFAASGAAMVVYLGPAGNTYHFNSIMPVFESVLDGRTLCLDLNNSCPNATNHTLRAQLRFPTQFGASTSTETSASTTSFSVVVKDEDPNCDPFAPGGDDCAPVTVPYIDCPIVGTIAYEVVVNEPLPTVTTDYYQRDMVTSVISGPTHIGQAYQWAVNVVQWCSNGNWEPYITTMEIENKDETLYYYWDTTVFQYAIGVASQVALAIPSTQGSAKKSNCTGSYQIPTV